MGELNYSSVYVGQAVMLGDPETTHVTRNDHDIIKNFTDPGNFFVVGGMPCRSVLFRPGDTGYAQDLLYSPSDRYKDGYPILNYADYQEHGFYKPGDIFIHKICDLGPVLKRFGYQVPSTPEEAWDIRWTFFDGSFPYDNSDAFGCSPPPMTQSPIVPFGCDGFGIPNVDSYLFYEWQAYASARAARANKEPLSSYYFDVLTEFGDRSFLPAMFFYNWRMNAFKPHRKVEGPVKALKR